MEHRDKVSLQYKALETILKCVSAIVLCSFIGWFIVDDANNNNASVEDYTYDADKKIFLNKNNQQVDIHIGLQQNAPEEQQSQIYLFKLNQKL